MKKNNMKPIAAALGSSVVMALSASANAADNPFQMVEFGEGVTVAGEAMDMQGNKVMINDETGFTYGGDQKAGYAGGKLATGKKDPAVCGTFAGETCSMPHLKK
jgi:hypothetical protein